MPVLESLVVIQRQIIVSINSNFSVVFFIKSSFPQLTVLITDLIPDQTSSYLSVESRIKYLSTFFLKNELLKTMDLHRGYFHVYQFF